MRALSLSLSLSLSLLLSLSAETALHGQVQGTLFLDYFRSHVDVDGDGLSESSDRAAFQWWLNSGGNLASAIEGAVYDGGVFDVSGYLSSPSAQLPHGSSSATIIDPGPTSSGGDSPASTPEQEATAGGGTSGGEGASGGPVYDIDYESDCEYVVVSYPGEGLPVDNLISVDDDFPQSDPFHLPDPRFITIGEAILHAQTVPDANIRVAPGVYFETIFVDLSLVYGTLTIYSELGPTQTVIQAPGLAIPTVEVSGGLSSGGPQLFRLGLVTSDVIGLDESPPVGYGGWHGFTITGAHFMAAAGVEVRGILSGDAFECRGCIITENSSTSEPGGGVRVALSSAVRFIMNEISHNLSIGANGIDIRDSNALFAKNWILQNRQNLRIVSRTGGGLRADGVDLQLCENVFADNVGVNGCGAYLTASTGYWSSTFGCLPPLAQQQMRLHVEGNQFLRNIASGADFVNSTGEPRVGGGLAIVQGCSAAPGLEWGVRVYNNVLRGNEIRSEPEGETGGSGGGMSIELDLDENYFESPAVVGNMMFQSFAEDFGGGAFLRCPSPVFGVSLGFHNNTVTSNESTGGSESGSGIFVDESGGYSSRVDAANNVVRINDPFDTQWHVVGSTVGPDPQVWRFSHIPAWNGSPVGGTGFDVFGAGNSNSTADPGIKSLPSPPYLDGTTLSTIDSADPNLDVDTVFVPADVNRDPRRLLLLTGLPGVGAEIDRGADEFTPDQEVFKRGDANDDNGINIADALYILAYLFTSGPPSVCADVADVTDDGTLNITDPVYLLAYLFAGGPAPPAPFPLCGGDPTADNNRNCAPYQSCP